MFPDCNIFIFSSVTPDNMGMMCETAEQHDLAATFLVREKLKYAETLVITCANREIQWNGKYISIYRQSQRTGLAKFRYA